MNLKLGGFDRVYRIILALLILSISLLSLYGILFLNIKAILVFGFFVICLILIISFIEPFIGIIICMYGMSVVPIMLRISNSELPHGIFRDLLLLIVIIALSIKNIKTLKRNFIFYKAPITLLLIIQLTYLVIQIFNPQGGSIAGSIFFIRGNLSYFIIYYLMYYFFDDYRLIKKFNQVWLALAILAALYALYQELFGLPWFDLRWVTSNSIREGLNLIGGRWRKWSFMTDAASFGMFMAFAGIYCFILFYEIKNIKRKTLYLFFSLLFILAMSFSGVRTSYVIFIIGVVFFLLFKLDNKRNFFIAIVLGLVFLGLLFGPFYGPRINRIRGAFFPSEDASMAVRDKNRKSIQSYIYEHPFGGGLATTGTPGLTYSPWHRLAGFPPDSLYLETALEQGVPGFLILLITFIIILFKSIDYISKNNPLEPKTIVLLAYTCGFFALTVGMYAKKGVFQIPLGFILMGYFAYITRISEKK